jgi:hypothetical protein
MERNWKERVYADEYVRQQARDQFSRDSTKPKSGFFKNAGTFLLIGTVLAVTASLAYYFSGYLGVQLSGILDPTFAGALLLLLGTFYLLLKS